MTTPIQTQYTVSQQSLNLVRQIVSAVGWSKSIDDIYRGGKMLSENGALPELSDTSWTKTNEEVMAMDVETRAAYQKQDKDWASKPIILSLTDKQTDIIKRSFNHFVETAAKNNQLGINQYLNEIIEVFGFQPTD